MKNVKQEHVSNSETVGGSLHLGEWCVLCGGVFSLSKASLRLFAFWHISTEIV
jgi:hypothetical protein